MSRQPLFTTEEWFSHRPLRGKVRETYELAEDRLLIIATDRISAFDVVAGEPIPDKGRVLTEMSQFWFNLTSDIVENHFLTTDLSCLPDEFQPHLVSIHQRSMIVKRAKVIPIEFVIRGYLTGSGWKEYQQSQSVCRIPLPAGLRESDRLPMPILTPATKAIQGLHDENISVGSAMELVSMDVYREIERASLAVYEIAAEYALTRGIIIADTKFEFGRYNGQLILVDEVLTPDSSRFWPVDDYQPGRAQASLDKQPLRDWLDSIDWNHESPMPSLPAEVVEGTSARYIRARDMLIGTP